MSPARQPDGSPRKRKVALQTPIEPTIRADGNAKGATVVPNKRLYFDPDAFLATIGEGRRLCAFGRKQTIFAQGDVADAVFYIQAGKVKLTVVSKAGKEATIGI
ncbi:MAG: cyclic nucleotide-binding domain-containing protein, partial [Candidatus Sulfotelmatobacter sp.]